MRLELKGEAEMTVLYREEFQDPGAVGTILGKEVEVTVHGKVDTSQIGTYELVYEMRNRIGMVRKKTRKVTVTSEEEPTITLKGDRTYYVDLNSEYIEPGYVAYDVEQQDITDQVIVRGIINPKQFGIYVLKYEVRDKSGNEAVVKRKVIVKDRELPTLTLKGYEAVTIYTDETYEEPGFVATDNLDGDLTNHVIVKDNIEQKPGVYQVKYQVTDSSGNTVKKTRDVYVISHLNYKEEYEEEENQTKGWWSDNKLNHKRPLGGNYGESLDEYKAYYLGEDKKVIYLTFDEGSNETYLKEIVDVLNKNQVKATFFLCQNYMASHASLIRDMVNQGHSIGNHTHRHKSMPSLATRETIDEYVKEIKDLGYEVFINFTSSGHNTIEKNREFAKFAKQHEISVIYFADTESIFTPEYVRNTLEACREEGVEAGMHLHDKNGTAEMLLEVALHYGCKYTDITMMGLGGKWHDGNLSTEHFLRKYNYNPGYEQTRLKTMLIQNLIKYNKSTAAVL